MLIMPSNFSTKLTVECLDESGGRYIIKTRNNFAFGGKISKQIATVSYFDYLIISFVLPRKLNTVND